MDEIDRIWDTSDHFETKVLQFIGIIAAGTLAAAALLVERLHVHGPYPRITVWAFFIGVGALLFFLEEAMRAASGATLYRALNPETLEKQPDPTDAAKIEKALLPAVAKAHRDSLAEHHKRVKIFRHSQVALLIAIASFFVALITYAQSPKLAGGTMTNQDTTAPAPSAPTVTPAPQPSTSPTTEPAKFEPVKIHKGGVEVPGKR